MKVCPKCNTEHEKSGKYCCRSCANSRVFSDSALEKKRNKSKSAIIRMALRALRESSDEEYLNLYNRF